MTRVLALLLAGCSTVAAQSSATLAEECDPPTSTLVAEARIRDAVEEHAVGDVRVIVERADGRTLTYDRGNPAERYVSHSTAKPVAMAVIAWLVWQHDLELDTRVQDVLPGWQGTDEQQRIEVRHLLSFTDNITTGNLCWRDHAATWEDYVSCVEALPAHPGNDPSRPLGRWLYSMDSLDILCAMAGVVRGVPWDLPGIAPGEASVWGQFQDATGLFAGAEWDRSTVRIPTHYMIETTAEEYLGFVRAVDTCTLPDGSPFLSPELCASLTRDQIPHWQDPRSEVWQGIGEGWHWGFGWWQECRSSTYVCDGRHVATIGRGGQYALMDREHGVRAVVSPTMGGDATFNGTMLYRAIEADVLAWAQLSR